MFVPPIFPQLPILAATESVENTILVASMSQLRTGAGGQAAQRMKKSPQPAICTWRPWRPPFADCTPGHGLPERVALTRAYRNGGQPTEKDRASPATPIGLAVRPLTALEAA